MQAPWWIVFVIVIGTLGCVAAYVYAVVNGPRWADHSEEK